MGIQARAVGPALPHVTETHQDGNVTVYAPSTPHVLLFNETASRVWGLADGRHTVEQIVDELATAYEVEADEIREQVTQTVQTFVDGGLIAPVT